MSQGESVWSLIQTIALQRDIFGYEYSCTTGIHIDKTEANYILSLAAKIYTTGLQSQLL